jgi:hypothetical protein
MLGRLLVRSYRGMGVAELRCVSGCECEAQELDGTWAAEVSLQQILQFRVSARRNCCPPPGCCWSHAWIPYNTATWARFSLPVAFFQALLLSMTQQPALRCTRATPQVSRHKRCRVRVTVAERPGSVPQQGHKVVLMGVMVSQFSVRLTTYESQVEVLVGTALRTR